MDSSSSRAPSLRVTDNPVQEWHMENYDKYIHGRIDPGVDSNISLVTTVDPPELSKNHFLPQEIAQSSSSNYHLHSQPSACVNRSGHFTLLPTELIDYIFAFLGPLDLASVSSTCKLLSRHANDDVLWHRFVREATPGALVKHLPKDTVGRTGCNSFRELYTTHDPHWFLTKSKLWFSDYNFTGKIILTRYNEEEGCIEGFHLAAVRPPPTFEVWEVDAEVLIHSFDPVCKLHLDQPILKLDPFRREPPAARPGHWGQAGRFNAEAPMYISDQHIPHGVFSNFMLARPVPEMYPGIGVWPDLPVPARARVRTESQELFVGGSHRPSKRSQMSDSHFRIRKWMEMGNSSQIRGIHLGEEVETFTTLDPWMYTPTEDKIFRGIWLGDYSGHGCEFLLMHQPETEPLEMTADERVDETVEEWRLRKKQERIYRGSLEAIKLTGDPNVPRGQITFVADDIGESGFVRNSTDDRFKGSRVVNSRGHIAARLFRNHKYMQSQLIMISPNRLAQYWVGFGHISFFERVNIEPFLDPKNDP